MEDVSDTPKDSQETPLTWNDVLRLHGVEDLPFWNQKYPDRQAYLIESMQDLLNRHGKEWFRQNREHRLREMDYLDDMVPLS